MESHPEVGMVGPTMLSPDGLVRRSTMRFPSVLNSLGRALALDRFPIAPRLMGGQMMSDFNHRETREIEILNGWFWFIRREALEPIGLLDESFFIYGEDMDWCYRFHQKRWKVVFCSSAASIHYGGASSSAAPVRFYLQMKKRTCNSGRSITAGLPAWRIVEFCCFIRLFVWSPTSAPIFSKQAIAPISQRKFVGSPGAIRFASLGPQLRPYI